MRRLLNVLPVALALASIPLWWMLWSSAPLLACCLIVIGWAGMATIWLKGEGEREWAYYQERQRWARLVEATAGIRVAFAQLHAAMQQVGTAFEKAVRQIEKGSRG